MIIETINNLTPDLLESEKEKPKISIIITFDLIEFDDAIIEKSIIAYLESNHLNYFYKLIIEQNKSKIVIPIDVIGYTLLSNIKAI